MITKSFKIYRIKEKVKGVYVVGIRMKDQQVDVTNDTNKARKYRVDRVNSIHKKLQLLCNSQRWEVVDTNESVELHYTDDIQEYKRLVIQGILDGFSPRDKSGPHAVNAEYIEDMVSMRKDEDGAEDLPYETFIPTSWSECYQNRVWIEDAVEQMLPGCITLYQGHMSVL